MGPVAQRRLGCLFTCTEKNTFVGIRRPFQWQERRALMRTITERLVLRMAAGAPPIGARGHVFHDRGLLRDVRRGHGEKVFLTGGNGGNGGGRLSS